MKKSGLVVILYFVFSIVSYGQYNVKNFGAKGDGVTLDTRAIQSAIDKAYANKGGVVNIPPGTYKIGSLILKDNIELHIQSGAKLLGSADYKDYTLVKQKYESRTKDLYAKYFMIFAEGAKNISITGSGIIYGNGLNHFEEVRPQNLRPFMIRLVNCENVIIRDVQLLESANWTLHLLGCREVNIDGVVLETRGEGNRDGLDIDVCQSVKVSNSRFSTTDDAIVLKATADEICENIVITNCVVLSSGGSGIKTGTESNGGFKNITVSNCVLKNIPVHAGIELMTVDGGIMQNILLDNITMDNVATPFFIRLGIRLRPYKRGQYVSKIEDVKDIYLNNISAVNAILPSSIIGLHSKKIKNITISNYTARYKAVQPSMPYNKVTFQEFDYPAAMMFKQLPAYGLYCRSVDELHLQNVIMYSAENEHRPAITFDRVKNVELFSVKASARKADAPMIHLRNSDNLVAGFCRSLDKNNILIETEENTVTNLHLTDNILHPSQVETAKVAALPDPGIFEDFDAELKYSVKDGRQVQGFLAHDLKDPLKIPMNINKSGALQLCLLTLNESSQPEKVIIKYAGIEQEFLVNWNEWGWAPVSLMKAYDKNHPEVFEIRAADPNSELKISKAYIRYQDIGFTD
jgi:hypothetical protein